MKKGTLLLAFLAAAALASATQAHEVNSTTRITYYPSNRVTYSDDGQLYICLPPARYTNTNACKLGEDNKKNHSVPLETIKRPGYAMARVVVNSFSTGTAVVVYWDEDRGRRK